MNLSFAQKIKNLSLSKEEKDDFVLATAMAPAICSKSFRFDLLDIAKKHFTNEYNSLIAKNKKIIIDLLFRTKEYSLLYRNFIDDCSEEQAIEVMMNIRDKYDRFMLASSLSMSEDVANQLRKKDRTKKIKFALLQNKKLDIEYRKKLITSRIMKVVIDDIFSSIKDPRWTEREIIEGVLYKYVAEDMYYLFFEEFEKTKMIKNIIE